MTRENKALKIKTAIVLLIAFILPSGAAKAAVELSITKQHSGKISYALPGGTTRESLEQLVRNGLDRSGLMACPMEQAAVDAMGAQTNYDLWSRQKIEILIIAQVRETADEISAGITVHHVSRKSRILTRRYSNAASGKGVMAAFICDDIVKQLTGESGIESSRIVYSATTGKNSKELFVTYPNGAGCQQVTFDKSISISPAWRDDGQKLLYTSYINNYPNIYAVDLKSGKRSRYVHFPGLNAQPAASPDGKTIAMVLSKDGNPEVYTIDVDSSRLTRITNTKAVESSPTWSPDGRTLAYTSDRGGSPQIYVQEARAGSKAKRVSFGSSYFSSPDWSPKENLIACSASAGGKYQIYLINPDTRDCRRITSENASFEDPSFAPSGKHLVLTRARRYRSELGTMALSDKIFRPIQVKGEDPATPDWAGK